jgi:hypothetical protein
MDVTYNIRMTAVDDEESFFSVQHTETRKQSKYILQRKASLSRSDVVTLLNLIV